MTDIRSVPYSQSLASGDKNMILGITWLREHNPEIDWRTGKVEMTERQNSKREENSINTCRTGIFPELSEETSNEEEQAQETRFQTM